MDALTDALAKMPRQYKSSKSATEKVVNLPARASITTMIDLDTYGK